MKTVAIAVAAVLLGTAASAQFVKGNEAVSIGADGVKRVETPPMPKTGPAARTKPCAAAAGCHGGAWLMVETRDGLRECTEAYARATSCRASTYGSDRLLRVWVIKSRGKWLQCERPDPSSKCVDMFARPPHNLPYAAVQ
jgi:hypothetical protein